MKNIIKKINVWDFKKNPLFFNMHKSLPIEQSHYALIGKLSTSILHDILSPLTSLALTTSIQNQNDVQTIIEHSTKEIKEYVSIMKHFLSYTEDTQKIHINREILQCITLLRHKTLSHGVQIQFIEFNQVYMKVHPLHIYQIVINLISNAIEASTKSKIKKIILIIKKDDKHVYIECKDFGIGMNKQTLSKIGTYNFSTKSPHRGFGLYSVIHITEHVLHGDISIQSEPHNGSFFSCKLPIIK